jgi:hypothetical protein
LIRCSLALALCTIAAAATAAVAQTEASSTPPRTTFWLAAGYGRGQSEQFNDVEEALSFNVSGQHQWLLLSVRVAAVSSSVFDTTWDLGLLGGAATKPGRPFHAGIAAGVGYAETAPGTDGLTVPAEVQLFWRFASYVGIGLYGFGSLNSRDSFGGATLALQFGRLR